MIGVVESSEILGELAQFGAAGLIAAMWFFERRGTAVKEARIEEAHSRLMEQREQLTALLEVVSGNTRAMTALETTQRTLSSMIASLGQRDVA